MSEIHTLDVAVKKTATITHVLDRHPGTKCDLEWGVAANFAAFQVRLEQRAHLSITRTTPRQDGEMQGEGEEIDQERDNDQSNNASTEMGGKRCVLHLSVAELVPEILDGIKTNHGRNEQPNKLDTADEAQAETGHEQPEEPLRFETFLLQAVEFGPAEDGGYSTEKEHRVEEDEAADGRIRVFAENHEGDEPDSRTPQVQLLRGVIRQWNTEYSPEGIERAHKGVVELLGVGLAGLELERSIVSGEDSREADKDFTERGVATYIRLISSTSPFNVVNPCRPAYTSKKSSRLI